MHAGSALLAHDNCLPSHSLSALEQISQEHKGMHLFQEGRRGKSIL